MTRARKDSKSTSLTTAAARRLQAFGPAPILNGEDPAAYNDLFERVSRFFEPEDVLEDIWVRDLVDLAWEVLRLRTLKAALLNVELSERLVWTLAPLMDSDVDEEEDADCNADTGDSIDPREEDSEEEDAEEEGAEEADEPEGDIVDQWIKRDPHAIEEVDALLTSAKLSIPGLVARILAQKIDTVEKIERMTAMLEVRRNSVLREFVRHRAILGAASPSVREAGGAAHKIVNAEPVKRKKSP